MKRIKDRIIKLFKGERGIVTKKYMKRFLPSQPVIVEAGAHIGVDTVELANVFHKGEIHAFEPVPSIYKQLVKNTQSHQNIKTHELALASQNGEADIFVSSGRSDGSSSLLKPKEHLKIHPDVKFEQKIKIKTITLDDWVKNNGISQVDFLWLDLQGLELSVLKASKETLKTVKAIYTEISLVENYENGPLYKELREWLRQQGFEIQKEAIEWEDGGNVFFVRKG
ncbi:MAG TPA: FkbM family methyltransferase [Candidatus Dormibacteraeota bacterium]|nr:FkbM family methyltransferase [Candidatus Dormibacteraeota bacterium]